MTRRRTTDDTTPLPSITIAPAGSTGLVAVLVDGAEVTRASTEAKARAYIRHHHGDIDIVSTLTATPAED